MSALFLAVWGKHRTAPLATAGIGGAGFVQRLDARSAVMPLATCVGDLRIAVRLRQRGLGPAIRLVRLIRPIPQGIVTFSHENFSVFGVSWLMRPGVSIGGATARPHLSDELGTRRIGIKPGSRSRRDALQPCPGDDLPGVGGAGAHHDRQSDADRSGSTRLGALQISALHTLDIRESRIDRQHAG